MDPVKYSDRSRKKIESVQRKAARFCMQDHRQRSSVTKMLAELDWETLEERRMKDRMIMTYRIRNDLVGIDAERYFHTRAENMHVKTRNRTKGNLMHMYPVKDVYKYSFIPRASREWNQLTTEAKEAKSLEAFKSIIRQDHISNHRGQHLLPKNWGLILKFTLPKFQRYGHFPWNKYYQVCLLLFHDIWSHLSYLNLTHAS